MSKEYTIPDSQLRETGRTLAWQRAGFRDKQDLFDSVDALDNDEKLDLLFQVFRNDITKQYLANKMQFIQSLGGRTYIEPEDVREHLLSEGYTEDAGWKFRDYGLAIYNHYEVDPETLDVDDCAWSMKPSWERD